MPQTFFANNGGGGGADKWSRPDLLVEKQDLFKKTR